MIINLQGQWTLKPQNVQNAAVKCDYFKSKESLTMNIPGDIHSALIECNAIEEPYFGKNELDVQWVGQEDWCIERTFTIDSNDFFVGQQFITLDYADTFAHVFINDIGVGTCDNMFRKWRFNVSHVIKPGENKIKIVFHSAEQQAVSMAKRVLYPIPYSQYPIQAKNRNFIRKTQCHGGWDWGPCMMVFGIYGSIFLEQTKIGFIDYVNTRTFSDDDKLTDWQVEVTTTFTSFMSCSIPVTVKIEGPDIKTVITGTPVKTEVGENLITHTLIVKNPSLWWPAGLSPDDDEAIWKNGEASSRENTLYTLTVMVGEESFSKKIGFKTLTLVRQSDKKGESFYFNVNGRNVFAKGSNWIPCDSLPERQTKEKYEYLIDSAIKAGQNMLRVWGGGQYEKDIFYDLCDSKGILVWQDCMFACAMYPATKKFLENVRQEIKHQVRRLKDHPCLAIWCGNNEDLGALNWFEESRNNRDRYIVDYDRLNEGVLAEEIKKLDAEHPWWPSSPSAGTGKYNDNWHSDSSGDMHYWSVWHERKPFEAFYDIRPRFVSEFGYQSFPSLSGVKEYATANDFNLTSPVMEFHQRNEAGNSIILENFSRYYRFPNGFENMLYLSQVQQAVAIKMAIEYWRSLKPHCMGSLYWQLNDIWPVASWSSIEYSGKWKLLQYAAKEFFAPVALSLFLKNDTIHVKVLNDTLKSFKTSVNVTLYSFNGTKITELNKDIDVDKDSVTDAFAIALSSMNANCDKCFIHASFSYNEHYVENTLLLEKPKACILQKPEITKTIYKNEESFVVSLESKAPAFYVSLDAGDIEGCFDKNMVTLLPNSMKKIKFTCRNQNVTEEEFEKALTITSLRDTY